MDQTAPETSPDTGPDTGVFDPRNLHFALRIDQPFCCFDTGGASCIPVTLSVGKGAPLELYGSGPMQILIGARLYANTGTPDEPERGALVGEYRAASGPFTAQKGRHYGRAIAVTLPENAPEELVFDFDLVWEGRCWGQDLGHVPTTMIVTKRRVALHPTQPDPLDMTETLMQLHDARAREARYEAVIFSLLNRLDKRGG